MKKKPDIVNLLLLALFLLIGIFIAWAIATGIEPPDSLIWVLTLYVVFRALSITGAFGRSSDRGDDDGDA